MIVTVTAYYLRFKYNYFKRCITNMNLLKCCIDYRKLVMSVVENSAPQYPEYSTFLSRLKTFDLQPLHSYQNKYSLAEGGFTYSGTGDLVQCFYCGLLLTGWQENDEVWQQHAAHNPKCVYVLLYKVVQFIENVINEIHKCKCKTESYDVVG